MHDCDAKLKVGDHVSVRRRRRLHEPVPPTAFSTIEEGDR